MSENKFEKQLTKILSGAKGRLYTLVIIAREDDWQVCSEVHTKLTKEYKQWTNFVYELSGKYSSIVEISPDRKRVRIRTERLNDVRKALTPDYF